MKNKTLELLQEAKNLSKMIAEAKSKKAKLFTEIADSFTPEEKQKQIAEAEKILKEGFAEKKRKIAEANEEYKTKREISKQMLSTVNVKHQGMGKILNHIAIKGNSAIVEREGKTYSFDITKKNWQKEATQELEKHLGNNVARNIVYKISKMQ